MHKKFIKLFSMVLCCVICGTSVSQAAEKQTLPMEYRTEIMENLTELDIPFEDQEMLIRKLENGEIWDSMKEENIELFHSTNFFFSPETPVKRMVFPDGSVLQQTVEFNDSITPIRNARSAMRTTFSDVQISVNNGVSGGGFYATYVIDWNAHNDGIISVRDPYCNVIGGDYSDLSVIINNSYENYSRKKPAEATYSVHVSYICGIGGAETLYIKMYVGNDKMVYGKLGSDNKITY